MFAFKFTCTATHRRAIKILRVHHAAVTFLATVAGANGIGPTHLVSGGSEGNVRFFDAKLRLVVGGCVQAKSS
jgi:hypothetical protein